MYGSTNAGLHSQIFLGEILAKEKCLNEIYFVPPVSENWMFLKWPTVKTVPLLYGSDIWVVDDVNFTGFNSRGFSFTESGRVMSEIFFIHKRYFRARFQTEVTHRFHFLFESPSHNTAWKRKLLKSWSHLKLHPWSFVSHIQLCFCHWGSLGVSDGVSFLGQRPKDLIRHLHRLWSYEWL